MRRNGARDGLVLVWCIDGKAAVDWHVDTGEIGKILRDDVDANAQISAAANIAISRSGF